jgi:hypothetical protein
MQQRTIVHNGIIWIPFGISKVVKGIKYHKYVSVDDSSVEMWINVLTGYVLGTKE